MDPVVDSAAPDPAPDAVVANVDPVAVPPAADPLPTDAAPTPPKKEPPPKWMLDRVAEETGKRRAVEGKVAELSDEVATLRRQLEAARGGQPPAQQPATPAQQAAVSQAQIDQAIEQRADAKLMQQARGEIVRAGHAEFGPQQFDQACNILAALDCVKDGFIADVLAVDRTNAHKLLTTLAMQPETAGRLSQLDSRARIAELTRLSMTAKPAAAPAAPAPAARAVSRAPAPPPPVQPSASKEPPPWYSDEASDADFDKGFFDPARLAKRRGLGR